MATETEKLGGSSSYGTSGNHEGGACSYAFPPDITSSFHEGEQHLYFATEVAVGSFEDELIPQKEVVRSSSFVGRMSNGSGRKRFRTLLLVSLLPFGAHFVKNSFSSLEVYFLADDALSFNATRYGLLLSAQSLPNLFMPFLGGIVLDSRDHRRALLLFLVAALVGHLIFAAAMRAGAFWVAVAGEVVYGLGSGTVIVAQRAIVSKFFVDRELVFALSVTVAVACVSKTIAKASVAPVAEAYGSYMGALWYVTFFLLLSLLSGIVYAMSVQDCQSGGTDSCGASVQAMAPATGEPAAVTASAGKQWLPAELRLLAGSEVPKGSGGKRSRRRGEAEQEGEALLPAKERSGRQDRSDGHDSSRQGGAAIAGAAAAAGAAGSSPSKNASQPRELLGATRRLSGSAGAANAAAATLGDAARGEAATERSAEAAENGAASAPFVCGDEETVCVPRRLHMGHPKMSVKSVLLTISRSTPAFWALVVLHTLFMMIYHLFSNFSGHFIVETYALSAVQAGYVTSLMPLVVVFGAPLAGLMLDYWGKQLWVLLGATLVTTWSYSLLLRKAASPVACIVLLALCESAVPAILMSGLPLVVDASVYGVAFGLSEVVYAAGLLVGNILMGKMRDETHSYAADLRAVEALCGVCLVLTITLIWWDRRNGCRLNRPRAAFGYKALPA